MVTRLSESGRVIVISMATALLFSIGCFPPAIEQEEVDGQAETEDGQPDADGQTEPEVDDVLTDTSEVAADVDTGDAPPLADGDAGDIDAAETSDVDAAEVVEPNACGGLGILAPGEPGTACGPCVDGGLVCDPGDPTKNTTRCDGASALNACQACGEIDPPLGTECGECGQVVCDDGGGGGTRCAEPSGGCETPLTCADLNCGQRQRACDEGDTTSDATCGECLPTWVEVGETCVGEAAPPSDLTATIDRDDRIVIQWTASVHATGYRIYRCTGECGEAGTWTALLPVAIAETSYPDLTAEPPALPPAPTPTASTNLPDAVTVTWAAVSAPTAPKYSYRIVAVGPSGDSVPSAIAVGRLTERPVTGYEVQIGDGGWQSVSGLSLVDTDAPAPTLVAGVATASQGTFADYVQLGVSGFSAQPGDTQSYRVRAVTAFGAGAASGAQTGRRVAGVLSLAWERSADSAPSAFAALAGATTTTFQDTGLPGDGVVRFYRAAVSAIGAASVTTAAVAGWRQPRPGVPQISSVTTELSDRVDIQWSPIDGATGYHVYRGATRLTTLSGVVCASAPCSFSDGGAPAAGAWAAPSGVSASTNLTTGVQVSWTVPTRPIGASQSYRVSALNQSGESELSTSVSGWRAAAALSGLQVKATVGGSDNTQSVGAGDTEYVHTAAPMATFAAASATATKGDHRAFVRVTVSGGALTQAGSVSYQVRGELSGGGTTPWSSSVSGRRATGAVAIAWQHATTSNAANWTTIPTATCTSSATTCEDSTAPALGDRRWYRVELSATGATTLTTAAVDGWRLAFEGIAAGENSTCAKTPLDPDGGRVWCWGANTAGQVGQGITGSPVGVPTLLPDFDDVVELSSAGSAAHFCARKSDNSVWCWGWNVSGQVGDGTSGSSNQFRATPLRVNGVSATGLALGGRRTCALVLGQKVQCWGLNDFGQLGDNSTEQRSLPVTVKTGPTTDLAQVSSVGVGPTHSCATRTNGEVWCWGANSTFQLGQTTPTSSSLAIRATALTGTTRVAGGDSSTCATQSNAVHCWGSNTYGELGIGELGGSFASAQPVGNLIASTVVMGRRHACTVASGSGAGQISCWGNNSSGQLGVGDQNARPSPTTVDNPDGSAPLAQATALSAGAFHTCVVRDGHPLCWGNNIFKALGDGTDTSRSRPVQVILP